MGLISIILMIVNNVELKFKNDSEAQVDSDLS
jgi:hypothetical protein